MLAIFVICFAALCGLCCAQDAYELPLCSQLIDFTEHNGSREGTFDIRFPGPINDSVVEVKVFVSDLCRQNICTLQLESDVDTAYNSYINGQPVRYKINFRKESKDAWVTGIVVRNSRECRAICKHEEDTVAAGVQAMKHIIYMNGKVNYKIASCDPLEEFSSDKCGVVGQVADLTYLVINGTVVRRGSWPWMAAIYQIKLGETKYICGGSIISKRAILTASHCFYPDPHQPHATSEKEIYVVLGRHNQSNFNEGGFVQYSVSSIRIHRQYRPKTSYYDADIALLFTDREINYTSYIRPACIWTGPTSQDYIVGKRGTIAGWGTNENRILSSLPMKVDVTMVSYKDCYSSYLAFAGMVSGSNFCAGDLTASSGLCEGDSGGGLFLNESGKWMIRGVLSSTIPSDQHKCDLTKYAVYTDVALFVDWINTEIN